MEIYKQTLDIIRFFTDCLFVKQKDDSPNKDKEFEDIVVLDPTKQDIMRLIGTYQYVLTLIKD